MVSGGKFIGVGFCLSSGEVMYVFNIFTYICSCTCATLCNMNVHVDMFIHGEIPADPSMTHKELYIDAQLGGLISQYNWPVSLPVVLYGTGPHPSFPWGSCLWHGIICCFPQKNRVGQWSACVFYTLRPQVKLT